MPLPKVTLRRGARARVLRGHPWVFSGELEDMPAGAAPGDAVDLLDTLGGFVGRGFLTPSCALALRILTRDPQDPLDAAFFSRRIGESVRRRARDLPDEQALRLVAGEADGLPGLVVDRYAEHLVVQASTAGMERSLPQIVDALKATVPGAASVLARHDIPIRAREGLVQEVRQLHGATPKEIGVTLAGIRVLVEPWTGHKTGFYLDQRDHLRWLAGRCEGRRILDVFCYVGAWAVAAAKEGAREVLGVDSSGPALARARRHAEMNGVSCRFIEANAFDWLRDTSDRAERFDGIVLDPPPFAKSKEDVPAAMRAYKELNLRALKMLGPGGWLYTVSCSQRVGLEELTACLREAAADAGRSARILAATGQSADHPVLLEAPETAYLKGLLLEVA